MAVAHADVRPGSGQRQDRLAAPLAEKIPEPAGVVGRGPGDRPVEAGRESLDRPLPGRRHRFLVDGGRRRERSGHDPIGELEDPRGVEGGEPDDARLGDLEDAVDRQAVADVAGIDRDDRPGPADIEQPQFPGVLGDARPGGDGVVGDPPVDEHVEHPHPRRNPDADQRIGGDDIESRHPPGPAPGIDRQVGLGELDPGLPEPCTGSNLDPRLAERRRRSDRRGHGLVRRAVDDPVCGGRSIGGDLHRSARGEDRLAPRSTAADDRDSPLRHSPSRRQRSARIKKGPDQWEAASAGRRSGKAGGDVEEEHTGARALDDDDDPPGAVTAPPDPDRSDLRRGGSAPRILAERHLIDVTTLRDLEPDGHQRRKQCIDAGLEPEADPIGGKPDIHPLAPPRRLPAPLDGDSRRHRGKRAHARHPARHSPFKLPLSGAAPALAPPHQPPDRRPRTARGKECRILRERRLDDQFSRRFELGRAGVAGRSLEPGRRQIEDADRVDQRHQEGRPEGDPAPTGIRHLDKKPPPTERRRDESRLGEGEGPEARIGAENKAADDLIAGVDRVGRRQSTATVGPGEVVATFRHRDGVDDPRSAIPRPGEADARRAADIEFARRPLAIRRAADAPQDAVDTDRIDLEHRRVAARHGEGALDDQLGAGSKGDRDNRAVDLAGAGRPDDHADLEPVPAGMGEADAEPTAIAVGRRHDRLAIDARPGLIPAGPVLLEERDQPAGIGIEVDVERPGPIGSGAGAEADGVDPDPEGRPPPEGRREGPVERLGNEGRIAALLGGDSPPRGAKPPNDEHRQRLLRRGGVGRRRRRRAGRERLPGGGGSRRQEQCHEEDWERATPPADGLPEERGDRQPPQAGASQAVERQRHPQACDGEGDRHEESPHATGGEKPEGREGETDQQRTPPQPARVDQTDAHPGTAPGALHEDPLAEAGVDRSLPASWGRDLGPGA